MARRTHTTVDSGDDTDKEGNDASEGEREIGVGDGDDAAYPGPDVEAVALHEPHWRGENDKHLRARILGCKHSLMATCTTGGKRPIARSIQIIRLLSHLVIDTEVVVAILNRRRLITRDAASTPCGTAQLNRVTVHKVSRSPAKQTSHRTLTDITPHGRTGPQNRVVPPNDPVHELNHT